jgi:hypothetical protein
MSDNKSKEAELAESSVTVATEVKINKKVVWAKDVTEPVVVHRFATAPAVIKIAKGVTISPVKFEFVRCDVALTMPCYAEHVDETFDQATAWVDARLEEELAATKEILGK